jgi:hypothetical protein
MDRYLLESGAPDGYQLEDASGVVLMETPSAEEQTGMMDFWGALLPVFFPLVVTFLLMRLR